MGKKLYTNTEHRRQSNEDRLGIGLKNSVWSFMRRCKIGLKKISHEVLNHDDESSIFSDRDTINVLFDCVASVATLTDNDTGSYESQSHLSTTSVNIFDENMCNGKNIDFSDFDPVKERSKLWKMENEPFIDGPKIWSARRKLWNVCTDKNTLKQADSHRKHFNKISPQYYTKIYKRLVVEDLPLTLPLNLQDAMKIINAGWAQTSKWERAAKTLG